MKTRRDSIVEWSLLQTESLKVVDFAVRSGLRIGVLLGGAARTANLNWLCHTSERRVKAYKPRTTGPDESPALVFGLA